MLVFQFSFIFCSSVELPKIKIEFPCVEDLFINVYVAHSKAQSIQANGMTYALFFSVQRVGGLIILTQISQMLKSLVGNYGSILAVWGCSFNVSIFRTFT